MKKKLSKIIFFLFIALCTGCNKNKQPIHKDIENSSNPTNSTYYRVRETVLPNPDLILQKEYLEEKDDDIIVLDTILQGNVIYRLVQVLIENKPKKILQIIESPYSEWKAYIIDSFSWDTENVSNTRYFLNGIKVTEDQEVYAFLSKYVYQENENKWVAEQNSDYLGLWNVQKPCEIQNKLPVSINTEECFDNRKKIDLYAGEVFYQYTINSNQLKEINLTSHTVDTYSLEGSLWGTIQNTKTCETYCYGIHDEQFGIWTIKDGMPRMDAFDLIQGYDQWFMDAVCSNSDNIYLTKGQLLWKIGPSGELETVSDFLDQGYLIDKIYDMSTVGETVYLFTMVEGDYCLLEAKEEAKPEYRQEIIIAAGPTIGNIQRMITKFNRRNDEYHISLIKSMETETSEDFIRRIQLETSAGNAPDIYLLFEEVMNGYARNGYLLDGDCFLQNTEELWPAALDKAKIDGIQYGIPYTAYLSMAVYSANLVGERESWTIEDMMEAVMKSDVDIAVNNGSPATFIYIYGLQDQNNKEFIDWGLNISHLKESPFLKLLEFAKKYVKTERYDYSDIKVASEYEIPFIPSFISVYDNRFSGNASYIGYPNVNGSGIYVVTNNLYISSTTKNQEGIEKFIDFILSADIQYDNSIGKYGQLPVHLNAINDTLSYYQNTMKWLTDAQVKLFKQLIQKAIANEDDSVIYSIIEEELPAYINDQKTAEEVAAIIHNRVQLYLNENN